VSGSGSEVYYEKIQEKTPKTHPALSFPERFFNTGDNWSFNYRIIGIFE
jgi:hypothetical protein